MRRRLLPMALLLLSGALLMFSCPSASSSWKPRIVILLAIDTLRADHLGCYGYGRPTTPFLDRLAREGVVFEKAFSQANNTRASFASILTGAYPYDTPPDFRLSPSQPTLASRLQAFGVQTSAYTGGGNIKGELGFSRGFDVYDDMRNFGSLHHTMPLAVGRLAQMSVSSAPGFIFVHGYDVHCPTWKPLGFNNLFARSGYDGLARDIELGCGDLVRAGILYPKGQAVEGTGRPLEPADVRHVGDSYDGALVYADAYVGLLMRRLKELGLADRVLLVVIGDHGEHLCEAGILGHGHGLHDAELHVPLILWGTGLPAGRRVGTVVELVDILPSIMDFLGAPLPREVPGRSLKGLAMGEEAWENGELQGAAVSIGTPSWATIRTASYRLIVTDLQPGCTRQVTDGPPTYEGLYAEGDLYGKRDLSSNPRYAPTVSRLRARLQARLQRSARLVP